MDNNDIQDIDFSDKKYVWEYQQEHCDLCNVGFDTSRGLNKHKQMVHKQEHANTEINEKIVVHINNDHEDETISNVKSVKFATEENNYNEGKIAHCELCDKSFNNSQDLQSHVNEKHDTNLDKMKNLRKLKIRFKEITNDRPRNVQWVSMENNVKEGEISYAEIKETIDNLEKCQKAKEKELSNFDGVYKEVDDFGQEVMGTRYVLSEKDNREIKAQFVVKGLQEDNQEQSDSPTASRETTSNATSIWKGMY